MGKEGAMGSEGRRLGWEMSIGARVSQYLYQYFGLGLKTYLLGFFWPAFSGMTDIGDGELENAPIPAPLDGADFWLVKVPVGIKFTLFTSPNG